MLPPANGNNNNNNFYFDEPLQLPASSAATTMRGRATPKKPAATPSAPRTSALRRPGSAGRVLQTPAGAAGLSFDMHGNHDDENDDYTNGEAAAAATAAAGATTATRRTVTPETKLRTPFGRGTGGRAPSDLRTPATGAAMGVPFLPQ